MVRALTCVAAACDAALRGHRELLLRIQEHLLPLVVLGPAFALRVGGRRLLLVWLDAATHADVPIDEYTAAPAALYEALKRFGRAFLDRAIRAVPSDARLWSYVVHDAVYQDARDVLELLHERMPRVDASLAMDVAAEQGNLPLLVWLRERHLGGSLTHKAFPVAAKWGSLALLEAFDRIRVFDWDLCAVAEHAARQGHLHIVQWLCEKHPVEKWLRHAMVEALLHDHLDVAEFLCQLNIAKDHAVRRETGLETICATGQIEKLRWLHDRGMLTDRIGAKHFELAKTHGQVDVLAFFEASFPAVFQLHMRPFNAANAQGGSVDGAQWALKRGLLQKSIGCVYAAASHGHIKFVRWYVAEMEKDAAGMEFFPSYTAVPVAAENGYLECVQFLVEKGWGEANPLAVIAATKHGDLELVQWLVEHCNGPIVFGQAVASAAARGHLDVVQWLGAKNAPQDKAGVTTAARHGHWRVVQWLLHSTTPSTATLDAAMFEAVRAGHLRVVRGLPWTSHCDHDALARVARDHGHVHVAKWIETYRSCVAVDGE